MATGRVRYEWDVETVEATAYDEQGRPDFDGGDVVDHNHQDTAAAMLRAYNPTPWTYGTGDFRQRCVLVRDTFHRDDPDDLIRREWAYLTDDLTLPERFDESGRGLGNGAPVPKRFHDELARAVAAWRAANTAKES